MPREVATEHPFLSHPPPLSDGNLHPAALLRMRGNYFRPCLSILACAIEVQHYNENSTTILDKTFIPPTNENKVLNYGFNKENIHDVYLLLFLLTDETKLIAFQYKIMDNILPCRSSLFRAGLVDDDICSLCKLENQLLVRMLYNCSESLLFWDKFMQWWQEKISETFVLSVSAILFGWHQNTNNKRVLNYVLIIAKYYIFTTSVCDKKLSFDCFLLHLNSKLDILRTIATKKQVTK